MKGYVYVLSNPAMPEIVKIGRSIHGGRQRARQIDQTGVPVPFVVEFEMLVDDCETIEALVHEALHRHRVNSSREFFRVPAWEARKAIIEADLAEGGERVVPDFMEDASIALAHTGSQVGISWVDAIDAAAHVTPFALKAAHKELLAHRERVRAMREQEVSA